MSKLNVNGSGLEPTNKRTSQGRRNIKTSTMNKHKKKII